VGESVLTTGWARQDGELVCDGVRAEAIARSVGTPAFAYSASVIRDQYGRLSRALSGAPHRIHYSAKANTNGGILSLLRELGAGVDIVSGGELFRALRAGFRGRDIVFSGVGKTAEELREALQAGVLLLNVESLAELQLLDEVARSVGTVAPVALRINPEVTVATPHRYTRTGEKGMKFGIPLDEALGVSRIALALEHVRLLGLDMHIGSQVAGLEPYRDGMTRLLELYETLRREGAALEWLDIGGGFAVTYEDETETDVEAFAAATVPALAPTGLKLIVEPGRYLVSNAGVLLTTVLYRKRSGGREYVITDAGMNDLIRPSHYDAFHRVEAVSRRPGRVTADIVGPVCESGDFFALEREIEDVTAGDVLAIRSAGAYGFAMASNYNSRPRAAEVLIDGDRFAVVTERERYSDLVRHEPERPRWRSA